MFDISITELLLIAVVAVIFIGPKEFPVVVRSCARFFFHIRNFWHEIKQAMGDIAKESGVDDIRRELEDEYIRDMKMIEGDDGQMYEAYDLDEIEQLPSSRRRPGPRGTDETSQSDSMDPGLHRDNKSEEPS